jgi:hypothetical protein
MWYTEDLVRALDAERRRVMRPTVRATRTPIRRMSIRAARAAAH